MVWWCLCVLKTFLGDELYIDGEPYGCDGTSLAKSISTPKYLKQISDQYFHSYSRRFTVKYVAIKCWLVQRFM